VDLIEEGADLGIRLGTLPDSSLVARKICDVERSVCASPAYLKKHGVPRRPDDLLRHNCLSISYSPSCAPGPLHRDGVRHVEVSAT
jgi:DNA-binding transcriptional LysR family regulator